MNLWNLLPGKLVLELTSANCPQLLDTLCRSGIKLKDVSWRNDLTLQLTVSHADYRTLQEIAEKLGANVKIFYTRGLNKTFRALLRRPVLPLVAILTIVLGFYLPSRVFFVSVEGNVAIPTNLILEAAEDCGIVFGAARRQVRSEVIKNALLQKIPELQWAGINTKGCTAVISVREKTVQETRAEQNKQVCSIVAARDGIIQNCTVYEGNPLCSVGQAVKAGQTLVSGYVDCGTMTKATRANAEVKALTFRELELISPAASATRGELHATKTLYSLKIGKKVINFYKDSGILDTTCAKIYSEEYVHLPGGFQLPVAIIKQTLQYYGESGDTTAVSETEGWLEDFAEDHLQDNMIAGQIISAQKEIQSDTDVCYLYGKFACMEMIGQVKYEQTITKGENND